MCSLLTVFTPKTLCSDFIHNSQRLLSLSQLRGPDESGYELFDNKVYLGSNRLRIVGESQLGTMPLKSLNGECWIVFNGEIYNHKELRSELENEGYKFFTHTDTEVLVNCYLRWKEDFVSRLNGIFAFTIYDKTNHCIVAARDRFGCKPLYFIQDRDFVALSSDFNTLDHLDSNSSAKLDPQSLTAILNCRFVPGRKTIYEAIKKLAPGEIRIWNLHDLNFQTATFWKPLVALQRFNQEEFEEKLTRAVNLTSQSDVRGSILLSGGLDSSSIAAILGEQTTRQFDCYSSYFKLSQKEPLLQRANTLMAGILNETELARAVADSYSLPYEDFELDYSIDIDEFNKLQWAMGEPIGVTNALGLYLFGKKLKGKTKMALSGTGSDELLGGYQDLYFKSGFGGFENKEPRDFLAALSDFDGGQIDPLDYLEKDLRDESYLIEYANNALQPFNDLGLQNELLNQLCIFELNFALPGWEMDMADRLFMDSSIELRPSFLENDFVNYCLTIPSVEKANKKPLREMFKQRLPAPIITGLKVPSLSTPAVIMNEDWFKWIESTLTKPTCLLWNKNLLKDLKTVKSLSSFDVYYRVIYLQNWLINRRNIQRLRVV